MNKNENAKDAGKAPPEPKKEALKGVMLVKKIISKNKDGNLVVKKYSMLAENEAQAKGLMAHDERITKA